MGSPNTASHLERYRFTPGNNANPAGRPKGSRHKINELTLKLLFADFEKNGEEVIKQVREKQPGLYLTAIVSLLPKQAEKITSPLHDISDDELTQLEDHLKFLRAKTVEQLGDDELRNTIDETKVEEKIRSYEQLGNDLAPTAQGNGAKGSTETSM